MAEMGRWACFREESETRAKSAAQSAADANLSPAAEAFPDQVGNAETGRKRAMFVCG